MKSRRIEWDKEKNEKLKRLRGVSFEDVVVLIENDAVLDEIEHPNKKKYPRQKIFILLVDDYVYAVPFVKDSEKIFLKTIIPSRKYTKKYLKPKK